MASASAGSPDLVFSSYRWCHTPACSRAPRRTSRGPSTNPEGPVIFAVLLGLPDGRWSESMNRDHGSCKALQRLVKEAFLSAGLQDDYCVTCVPAMSSTNASGPTVIGIARMIKWPTTTVSSSSGHDALAAAMEAALRLKRSRSNSIQFLYHKFLEVANLDPQSRSQSCVPTVYRPQTWQTH